MKIAIIGAGFSGTNLYRDLKKDGHQVKLFEKSRGIGGRCSTKYVEDKLIDHGAAFFEAQNEEFIEFCDLKVKENILTKNGIHYSPTNGMNKLCSSMVDKNDLIKNTKIISCKFENKKWCLKDESDLYYSNFDKLILTIPATQILQMDIKLPDQFFRKLKSVKYNSIASLLIFANSLENILHPKLLSDSSFKKVIDNSSKYNYKPFSSYVIHLSEELTNQQELQNKEEVERFINKTIYDITGINLSESFYLIPHLWKYAFVTKSLEEDFLYHNQSSLGLCGDYFKEKDLEGAFLSAKRLYESKFK